mmetsp:Transcript_5780/g.8558  ORF Transcript_5780/g.8558 Transcript_5780/m.8558 type:complete len:608 (-) Transcript_5780:174-1997(-)
MSPKNCKGSTENSEGEPWVQGALDFVMEISKNEVVSESKRRRTKINTIIRRLNSSDFDGLSSVFQEIYKLLGSKAKGKKSSVSMSNRKTRRLKLLDLCRKTERSLSKLPQYEEPKQQRVNEKSQEWGKSFKRKRQTSMLSFINRIKSESSDASITEDLASSFDTKIRKKKRLRKLAPVKRTGESAMEAIKQPNKISNVSTKNGKVLIERGKTEPMPTLSEQSPEVSSPKGRKLKRRCAEVRLSGGFIPKKPLDRSRKSAEDKVNYHVHADSIHSELVCEEEDQLRFYSFAHSSKSKYKPTNQDAYKVARLSPGYPLISVFDGHGFLGHLAASYCASHIHLHVEHGLQVGKDPNKTLKEVFKSLQDSLISIARMEQQVFHMWRRRLISFSSDRERSCPDVDYDYGTTGTVCVVVPDASGMRKLWIAHVGDSRCVVLRRMNHSKRVKNGNTGGKSKWKLAFSTLDHNCHDVTESERVKEDGGQVMSCGGDFRVYPKGMSFDEARSRRLSLNMSRSLGHIILSKFAGISSEPTIKTMKLGMRSEYLVVVASDGIWDYYDTEDLLDLVGSVKSIDLQQIALRVSESASNQMDRLQRGDNLTISLMHLPKQP